MGRHDWLTRLMLYWSAENSEQDRLMHHYISIKMKDLVLKKRHWWLKKDEARISTVMIGLWLLYSDLQDDSWVESTCMYVCMFWSPMKMGLSHLRVYRDHKVGLLLYAARPIDVWNTVLCIPLRYSLRVLEVLTQSDPKGLPRSYYMCPTYVTTVKSQVWVQAHSKRFKPNGTPRCLL